MDSHIPPQTVTPVRGRPERDDRVNVEDTFAFDPSNLNSCSPEWLEVMELKSHLCVRMLEKAIGAEQLLQVRSLIRLSSVNSPLTIDIIAG